MGQRAVIAQSTTDSSADDALVNAARSGDRSAFGMLYDRYARMVHGILLCRVPPREVDDLVSEVFLLALRKLHSLRELSRFGAWLSAITRNRANDYYRDASRAEKPMEPKEEEKAQSRSTDHVAEEEAAMTLAVLRTLPETYREPLMLRLVEGMTGPEIAARMGLTHGSVRVNLHRGMQMLREKLAEKPVPQVDDNAKKAKVSGQIE